MTDVQKMKINTQLSNLTGYITDIEDTCDELRDFIKNIKMLVDTVQEDHTEWISFTDLDDDGFLINQYKCIFCGCIWKHQYNYCPYCGANHKEV